jgi:hypothetical protein
MKFPKNWNKMKISEQEEWLVNKLYEVYELEALIKKNLASTRGGQSIHVSDEISRPDEAILKDV